MKVPDIFVTRVDGEILTLEVHGTVSSLANDSALAEVDRVLETLQAGTIHQVIVDFCNSPYFGSTMLETLRRIWNEVHRRKGHMVFCNVSPVGLEILQVAKFDQLWPVAATRGDAELQLKAMC